MSTSRVQGYSMHDWCTNLYTSSPSTLTSPYTVNEQCMYPIFATTQQGLYTVATVGRCWIDNR